MHDLVQAKIKLCNYLLSRATSLYYKNTANKKKFVANELYQAYVVSVCPNKVILKHIDGELFEVDRITIVADMLDGFLEVII